MLLNASAAHAEFVTFITTGSFSGGSTPGTSTYTDAVNGISISFTSSANNNVDVPPTSQVSFGQFDTSATTAAVFAPVVTNFTLTILQLSQSGGTLDFLGTLSGQLRIDNSQVFVQFNTPLTGTIGTIFYSIASADDNTPGRVNIAPPQTNNGLTTVVGRVGVVPEPSSFALLALGCPAVLAIARRGRRKLATVAVA